MSGAVEEEKTMHDRPTRKQGKSASVFYACSILLVLFVACHNILQSKTLAFFHYNGVTVSLIPISNVTNEGETAADAFQIDNLKEAERINCGKNKCFFPIKTDTSIGYLVARSTRDMQRWMPLGS